MLKFGSKSDKKQFDDAFGSDGEIEIVNTPEGWLIKHKQQVDMGDNNE